MVFFGTPHAGSSIADWTNTFGKVLNLATLGMAMNHQLVGNLKEGSATLYDISKSFVDRGKALRIVSFYETDKLKGTNMLVSTEHSIPSDRPISLCD